MLQFLVATSFGIDHGSEKAMTFRRSGQIIERQGQEGNDGRKNSDRDGGGAKPAER